MQRCWCCKEKKENKKDKNDKNEKTVSQACYVIPFFCADNSALLRDTISKIGKRRWELGMESFDVGWAHGIFGGAAAEKAQERACGARIIL